MKFKIFVDGDLFTGELPKPDYEIVKRLVNQVFPTATVVGFTDDTNDKTEEYVSNGIRGMRLVELMEEYVDIAWKNVNEWGQGTKYLMENGPEQREDMELLEMRRWDSGKKLSLRR